MASNARSRLKAVPTDIWSLRERLSLACSVMRSGDQNWVSVSRAIKPFSEPNRSPDWFSQKNCALQYSDLLEKVQTPKRKRGERELRETPGDVIVRKLTIERIEQLKRVVQEEEATYKKLKTDIEDINCGLLDDELKERWLDTETSGQQRAGQTAETAATTSEVAVKPPSPAAHQVSPPAKPKSPAPSSSSSLLKPKTEPVISEDRREDAATEDTVVGSVIPSGDDGSGSVAVSDAAPEGATGGIVKREVCVAAAERVDPSDGVAATAATAAATAGESRQTSAPPSAETARQEPTVDVKTEEETTVIADVIADVAATDTDVTPVQKSVIMSEVDATSSVTDVAASQTAVAVERPDASGSEADDTPPPAPPGERRDASPEAVIDVVAEVVAEVVVESPITEEEEEEVVVMDTGSTEVTPKEIIPEGGVEEEAEEEEQEQEEQEEADEGEGKKGEEGPTGETGEDEDDDQEEEVEDGQMPPSTGPPPVHGKLSVSSLPSVDSEDAASPASSAVSDVMDEGSGGKTGNSQQQPRRRASGGRRNSRGQASVRRHGRRLTRSKLVDDKKDSPRVSDTSDDEALTPLGSDDPMSTGKLHPSVIESLPNSPSSITHSDTEDERAHKTWKRSIMLVWRSAANHKYANVFLHRVRQEIAPGYISVVFRPMDLYTIKKHIESGEMRSTPEFQRDMMLMFTNAIMYNNRDHNVHHMAVEMYNDVLLDIEQFVNTQLLVQTETKVLRTSRRSDVTSDKEDEGKKKRTPAEQSETGGKTKKRRA